MATNTFKRNRIIRSFLLTSLLTGFAGMMHCDAQSIIGKWKQISGKMYCTPDAVKNSHGHLHEVMEMPRADVVDEFKTDHTITETVVVGQTKTINSGTWTMTGKTVTITITSHTPMSGIVSDTFNTLTYTVEMPKSEHMQVIKRQWTYSKV